MEKYTIELVGRYCKKHNILPDTLVDVYEQHLQTLNSNMSLLFVSKGVELIAIERQEQMEKHGFDVKHDKEFYEADELVHAALFAITGDWNFYPKTWGEWWAGKMVAKTNSTPHSKIERLKIAGALLAAEIDRLQSIGV